MLLAIKDTSGTPINPGGAKPSSSKLKQIIRIGRPGGHNCPGKHHRPAPDAEESEMNLHHYQIREWNDGRSSQPPDQKLPEEKASDTTALLERKPRKWRKSGKEFPWPSSGVQTTSPLGTSNWDEAAREKNPKLQPIGHPCVG